MRPTTEAATRALLIDPALRSAGWNTNDRSRVALEIPVDGYDKEPWNGVTDYCLYDATGNVIAVVEAKKCSRNARDADEQLRHYVTEIAKRQSFSPFGFMSNGRDTYFWEVGIANPRPIAGFFSPDDLDRLLFLRQNQLPLASAPINTAIADRPYQHEAIRRVAEAYTFWTPVTWQKIEFLRARVGPLLRFAAQIDVAAETFTSKVERLKLQILNASPYPSTLESIVDDVSRLPEFVLKDARVEPSVKLCLSHELAKASPKALTQVIRDLAPQMNNRRERVSAFLKLDLPDFIHTRGLISIGDGGEQVYVEQYRRRVEERILKIVENHSTMAVIRSGGDPTDLQLIELERTLQRELGGDGIELTADKIRRAYGLKVDSFLGFLRHVLDLDALPDYSVVVERSFSRHIAAHQYSADQIRFLRAVQEVFLYKRQLELQDFYESPLTNFGRNAVDRLFTPAQVQEIIGLANQMAA